MFLLFILFHLKDKIDLLQNVLQNIYKKVQSIEKVKSSYRVNTIYKKVQ